MRAGTWVPVVLLAVGIGLVLDAVVRGGASVALVVIVPVVFGASLEFFLGVIVLFFGLVTLPLAFGYTVERAAAEPVALRHGATPSSEVGGLILIGPLPIFFGRWGSVSRATRIAVAVAGGLLLVVVAVALYWYH